MIDAYVQNLIRRVGNFHRDPNMLETDSSPINGVETLLDTSGLFAHFEPKTKERYVLVHGSGTIGQSDVSIGRTVLGITESDANSRLESVVFSYDGRTGSPTVEKNEYAKVLVLENGLIVAVYGDKNRPGQEQLTRVRAYGLWYPPGKIAWKGVAQPFPKNPSQVKEQLDQVLIKPAMDESMIEGQGYITLPSMVMLAAHTVKSVNQ